MNIPADDVHPGLRARAMKHKCALTLALEAFSIAVCIVATIACVIDLMHARGVAREAARRQAQAIAQSLAIEAADTFSAADGALYLLARSIEQADSHAERPQLQHTIVALSEALPRVPDLAIFDQRGRLVTANFATISKRWPGIADRPYFRYHRSHPGSGIYISGPAISKKDARKVLFVSRRIERNGAFTGVVVAPIPVESFERYFATISVGPADTLSLVELDGDRNGTVIVRRPQAFIGRTYHFGPPNDRRYDGMAAASFIAHSPFDGVRRLVAFERLPRYPVLVAVGLAESDYLAACHRNEIADYVALAVTTALIGMLVAALKRQLAHRRQAEAMLANIRLHWAGRAPGAD